MSVWTSFPRRNAQKPPSSVEITVSPASGIAIQAISGAGLAGAVDVDLV
jgi:hypothetical protein